MGSPELLAPAGNMECLHAAVRAGADAVYLGLDRLNARRGADNFTLETLAAACDFAHLRGVRVYVAVNTAVMPGEFDAACELVRQAWRAGADAFIVQDVGLASRLHEVLPVARLHASTQMNVHSEAGMEAARALGFARVTLARELALSEVEHLVQVGRALELEVEVFAHGALCICYSGQCYASSMVGDRSANRGMCAQACRLPYELHNRAVSKPLPASGEHLLSPKDLCAVDLLARLRAAGVASLKVEGRMKAPEYVSAVVGVYADVLRALAAAEDGGAGAAGAAGAVASSSPVTEEQRRTLAEAFSRGFTEGYLSGEDGREMMSYQRPNNRGVPAGRVTAVHDGKVSIEPTLDLEPGDVVEFWTNRGHFAHTIASMQRRGKLVVLPVSRAVGKGDRVFRVRAAAAAFCDSDVEPRVPVDGTVELRIGRPARLELRLAPGDGDAAASLHAAVAEGDPVEPARTKPASADDVRAHVDRFGSTPFELRHLDVQLDEGAGIGFSALHHLRAEAASALERAALAPWHERKLPRAPKGDRNAGRRFDPHAGRPTRIDVVAIASNPACARAARKAGADLVYVPAVNFKRGEACVAGQLSSTVAQAGYPSAAAIALPVAAHDPLPGTREHRFGFDPYQYVKAGRPVLAESAASVLRCADAGALPEAGPHAMAANAAAVEALVRLGATRVWLSPELTLGQIQQIGEATTAQLGLVVSGAAELMVCEHCLLSSQGACDRDCGSCARRRSPHFLRDRKGFELPVVTDCTGRSHLYNAVPTDLLHAAPDLYAAGVTAFMVDTVLLNVEQATKAVARAVRARDLAVRGVGALKKAEGATTGHLYRAVK